MWTQENRSRHQQVKTALKRGYPTDVKDEEWRLIAPLLPRHEKAGGPRNTDLRTVSNALRYMVRPGCEWHMLVRTIHDLALMLDRMCYEGAVLPTVGIIDS